MDLGLLPPTFFFNFVGVPHSAAFVFRNFQIEPELGAGIDPGLAFTKISSTRTFCSMLDKTKFEPTNFRS